MATLGKIQLFLINWFGENYKTTFYGFVSKLSMVGGILMLKPDFLNFLPPASQDVVGYICLGAYLFFGFKGNSNAVDINNIKPSSLVNPQLSGELLEKNQV